MVREIAKKMKKPAQRKSTLPKEIEQNIRRELRARDVSSRDEDFLVNLISGLLASTQNSRDGGVPSPQKTAETVLQYHQILLLLKQQANELETLKRLSLHLTSSLHMSTVLDAIVSDAILLFKHTSNIHIFLYDAESDQVEFAAALDKEGRRNRIWRHPRPDGLTYTVAHRGEMVIVEDMRKHPLYKNAPPEWSGSIIGIPLKANNVVVGVMNLSRTTTGPFRESDLRLLRLLADQAAIAISNARVHEALSKKANLDTLTGLPNRRALDEHLENELRAAQLSGDSLAVVMMDLDGFKQVNDTYGHDVGDNVLRTLFQYLARGLRASDFLARYGGDELTLILSKTNLAAAKIVTRKFREKLRAFQFQLPDNTPLRIGISGGIAVYPLHGNTESEILRAADEALYYAKKYQRGSFVVAKSEKTTPVLGE